MCLSLFQDLSNVEARLQEAGRVSLFLDFDGTLVPIGDNPGGVCLDARTRETLARIEGNDRIVMAVISGRAISDLLAHLGLEGLVYAGNHGLEICGRGLRFVEPGAAARRDELQELARRLASRLQDIPGVVIESKGLSASVHYRAAPIGKLAEIEHVVGMIVAEGAGSFVARLGRMAFDILPRTGWHKGAAVRWINHHLGADSNLSICLGDDTSDEDAFRVLPDGITVKVGDSARTSARYYLADPDAVTEFLMWLANHVPARQTRN